MSLTTRVGRAIKELLGKDQWPARKSPLPVDLEEQTYEAVVMAGDVIYDVGANIGNVAVLFARLAGRDGHVFGFEPIWPNYLRMNDNVQLDTHWKAPIVPLPFGLAEVAKTAEMNLPGNFPARASLAPAEVWRETHGVEEVTRFEARFVKLDEFMRDFRVAAPDILKIDVEGAETFVLRGATECLASATPPLIVMELMAPWMVAFGLKPWDVLSLLASNGYHFIFVCPDGLLDHVPSTEQAMPEAFAHGSNIVAYVPDVHADRIANLRARLVPGRLLPSPPPPVPNREV